MQFMKPTRNSNESLFRLKHHVEQDCWDCFSSSYNCLVVHSRTVSEVFLNQSGLENKFYKLNKFFLNT